MRWLTSLRSQLRASEPDRGATIVTVALMLTVLMAFIGLGVDGAAAYAKKQQVQNGADAAAMALAQEYAVIGCAEDYVMADDYVRMNTLAGEPTDRALDIECGPNSVKVDAVGQQAPYFMQIIGMTDLTVKGSATVEWGSPTGGRSMLPIAISACSYFESFGGAPVIGSLVNLMVPGPSHKETECSYHEEYPPGGFSWLDPSPPGTCGALTSVGAWVGGDTGQNVPGACGWADFDAMIGQTVLLPIFNDSRGKGSSGEYHIMGYAALTFHGFHFQTLSGGTKGSGMACTGASTGPKMCLIGEFRGWTEIGDWELGPIDDTATRVLRYSS